MKNFYSFFTLALLFTAIATSAQMQHVPGELLAQFHPQSSPEQVIKKYELIDGRPSGIALGKLRSAPMNIYTIHFDENAIGGASILRVIKADKEILNVQFNHYIHPRETVPNDPNISQQWHHVNTGSNSGTEDSDIDSDEAWDITTGGTTALGDTIVVCIIEGGNLNHVDLIDNAWFNYHEIPDNGIDDDENGYIDDFNGWNVNSNDDSGVYQGGHGTSVMGMIGAKGDNGIGVVGANWNVKMMSVAGESALNEASVVEAYTYPLVQRQMYDATNGELGAFVVVTNASWGIDNGNPDDVPIWSAFYDTLGVYGILNCGATANNDVNIDIVGDIPTAVESDYMISVTATNNNDVRTFSGFGVETVDVGAPGQNIYTTSGSDEYNTTSGTSFASPLTAGVVALLYSVPCQTFAQLVKDNPQLGADYVREMLFQGVDPVENLELETKTGGRINAHNSLQLLLNNCGEDLCLPPFSFNAALSNDTIYDFSWTVAEGSAVTLRFRPLGSEDWTYVENIVGGSFQIDTLAYCTDYEFQVASDCSGDFEDLNFGTSELIETKGCCVAPETLEEVEVIISGVEISWSTDFAIDVYDIYYKLQEDEDYIFAGSSSFGNFSLTGLDSCTFYDVFVRPACIDGFDVGGELTIRTKGCGNCLDLEFCESFGESSSFEFIDQVQIGDFDNLSGNDDGYAIFEDTGLELEQGTTYQTILTPGFSNQSYPEFFRVWIDMDQDGTFSADEEMLSSAEGSSQVVEDSLAIPSDALLGATRFRVAMKYVGGFIADNVEACEVYNEGETEDYCITIVEGMVSAVDESGQLASFNLYPNPSEGDFQVNFTTLRTDANYLFQIFDLSGKVVEGQQVFTGNTTIDIDLVPGIYLYSLTAVDGETMKNGKLIIAR